jgi:uncharacterized membrane protein
MRRLSYIDFLRGLACLGMFIDHSYDSWLRPDLRATEFFRYTQIIGALPAPLFLFLAGISSALVTEKLRQKGITRNIIAKQAILRGAEIFGLGLLFRIQEYILGYRWVPWTDLFRVDILNILGLSMICMGLLCWLTSASTQEIARARGIAASLLCATLIALLTPPLWTTARPRFLPWVLESYINGVHTQNEPQHWLFPIFPWSAFAFAGLAVGFLLFTDFAKQKETRFFFYTGVAGAVACILAVLLDRLPIRFYSVYDYWHSDPIFLLLRCGLLLILMFLAFAWCRWGWPKNHFSPLIQMGNTSLLIYWVHIEFVYGRLSFLPKHRCSIPLATLGLCIIFLAMLALSLLRTRYKNKKGTALSTQPESLSLTGPAT